MLVYSGINQIIDCFYAKRIWSGIMSSTRMKIGGSIDVKNFKSIFYNNFDDFKHKRELMKLLWKLATQEINMTNNFELGGTSFTQSP